MINILIVNADNRSAEDIKANLNMWEHDWQVSIIDSGKECLDIVKNGDYLDAIILGTQLSDMSYFDLIKHIRDDLDVPIIVLSNSNDIAMLVRAFDAGANDYIWQSLNIVLLVARLKAQFRRREWDILNRENKSNKVI